MVAVVFSMKEEIKIIANMTNSSLWPYAEDFKAILGMMMMKVKK